MTIHPAGILRILRRQEHVTLVITALLYTVHLPPLTSIGSDSSSLQPSMGSQNVANLRRKLLPALYRPRRIKRHVLFDMRPITPVQCAALQTSHCYLTAPNRDCSDPDVGLWIDCAIEAGPPDVAEILRRVAGLNASRGVSLQLFGPRQFPDSMFSPARDLVIALSISNFTNLNLFMLEHLDLPQLQGLYIQNCAGVIVQANSLLAFSSLKLFAAKSQTTFSSIEQNPFEKLSSLVHISLEAGFDLSTPLPKLLTQQLRLFHCGPQYRWLRDFLDQHPALVTETLWGSVFNTGGINSMPFDQSALFIPVNCIGTKDDFVAEPCTCAFSTWRERGILVVE